MDIKLILIAVGSLGVVAIVFAVLLGFASKVFQVPVDQKVQDVRAALPGANCGACGYPGCDGLANAIVNEGASIASCPVGGADLVERLAEIMGQVANTSSKQVAVVRCAGDKCLAEDKFEYKGIRDCRADNALQGGHKKCPKGCLGCGTCVDVCQFDAIHVVNGVAKVDRDKCTACELCIKICPRDLISLMPYDNQTEVRCSTTDKGKDVRGYCKVGCIGCKICEKNCPVQAITVDKFLAHIDKEKCVDCGLCIKKCPQHTIRDYEEKIFQLPQ